MFFCFTERDAIISIFFLLDIIIFVTRIECLDNRIINLKL